ncbi:short-chain dehydrogenase/reductase SDR [Cyathus striatus]|nr:short-chain dehydrogenase/reductase SDR [Cyathus striatus]
MESIPASASTQHQFENDLPSRPSRSLTGRVAIVTGAGTRASGLGNGRAAAILLAEAGATVVCIDLNKDWADETVNMICNEFGEGKSVAHRADITKEEDCKHSVDIALEKFGRLDILVNNVGVGGPDGTAVEVDIAKWTKAMEINVTYAVPAMEKNTRNAISGRGAIVNIASITGMRGGAPMLLYPTSKGAVVNMTRAMAAHHAPSGIRVNCVCPGFLYTPMVYAGGMSEDMREARRTKNLLKTEGNAWDCGLAVRFLASDEARWITGVILPVDAGNTSADFSMIGTIPASLTN